MTEPGGCHLPNTAHFKSVRTLLEKWYHLRRYYLKLPLIFLPFLRTCSQGVCHFCRGLQGHRSGGPAMCGTGHLAQGWLPRRTQGGMRRVVKSSSQTPEEDGLSEALKCHHSVVWHKSHPNWKVSYYKLKHIITICLRRLHIVSSFRKWTAAGRVPEVANFYVLVLQT